MPRDEREPQSYGSGSDWVSGRTGQEVNRQKGAPAPEHREFYDERRESEESAPDQGGRTTDVQAASNLDPSAQSHDASGLTKVTARETGAKRGSFFRKRDYE